MYKKLLYSAPEAELLVVKFEGNFCGTNDFYTKGGGGSYGDDVLNDNGEDY